MIYLHLIWNIVLGFLFWITISAIFDARGSGRMNLKLLERLEEKTETGQKWAKSDVYAISKQVILELLDKGLINEDINSITRGYEELSSRVQRLIEAVDKLAKPCAKKKEKKQ